MSTIDTEIAAGPVRHPNTRYPQIGAGGRRSADRALAWRRALFATLVTGTCALLFGWMALLLGADGYDVWDVAMLACYLGTLPWVVIGLWNAVVGVALLHLDRDWLARVLPIRGLDDRTVPFRGRTAVVMPVYNENPERVVLHLSAVAASLRETGQDGAFEYFLLSDTQDPAVHEEERRRFEAWQRSVPYGDRVHYRRRTDNARQKVGNIEDFCARWGDRFKYMLVLDADSVMSGDAVLRLVRAMEANPRLGILQSLVVGLPAKSAFARIFQFGMRHGMRAYTTGSAWWQGDAGPYWGHNAILRLKPFVRHCQLPRLPGEAPLGGEILSHDQVEAAMMRAAGYDVRVLPLEEGSYEENPPTLPDFIKRDLRWCQGNLQYLRLLHWDRWRPMGRIQLALAILMYLSAPLWMGFVLLGVARVVATALAPELSLAIAPAVSQSVAAGTGVYLFALMMFIIFAPKIMGMADAFLSAEKRRAYGGGWRLAASSLIELLFGVVLAPVMAVAQTLFIAKLFLGGGARWAGQLRDPREVRLVEAVRGLWPQTLFGLAIAVSLAVFAPSVLPWAVPMFGAMVLAIPFALLTARPGLGRWAARHRLCLIPEETAMPAIVRAVMPHQQAAPLLPANASLAASEVPPVVPGRLSGRPVPADAER